MNITDYVNNYSREDRTQHIDLSTPCQDAYAKKSGCRHKIGQPITCNRHAMSYAQDNLKDLLSLSGKTNRWIQTCHLCNSNTKHGLKCVNPEHLYFGSAKENYYDKSKESREAFAKNGAAKGGKKTGASNAKKAISNGKHMNQQLLTCPHCGKSNNQGNSKRWHFDNCKHKV